MCIRFNAVRLGIGLMLILAVSLFSSGCSDNPVESVVTESPDSDVAMSLASAVGEEDGGVADQIGDLTEFIGPEAVAKISSENSVVKSYDSVTGTWTIEIMHQRGLETGLYYAHVERTYLLRYRNKLGEPMQYWTNGVDTAYSVLFDIVSGSGRHWTPRLSQALTGLSGSWVATGCNTDTITINGSYFRSAVDTLTTARATRTLDHSLQMNLVNVVGPRGSRLNLAEKISGTVTGTYQAEATFQRGEAYRERNINREFSINLGDGTSTIIVNGVNYKGDIQTGDIE
jgi:hypothetical protein